MSEETILQAAHVTKQFAIAGNHTLTACNDISISLRKGETLGIVGESGCGKTTFVRLLMQIEKPTAGTIRYRGEDISSLQGEARRLHRQHMQMVFQDPMASFHPKMRVQDILTEPLINFFRLTRAQRNAKAKELLRMVELPEEFAERYPHSMSGGQRQRVCIARALSLEPEILVCDEATSALDVTTQRTVIELLVRLQREKGIGIVFICHDIALISAFAHDIAVMYLGSVVEQLPSASVAKQAMHPYTKTLMSALFSMDLPQSQPIATIKGEAPSPIHMPQGCPFWERCPSCTQICKQEKPQLVEIASKHIVACHHIK